MIACAPCHGALPGRHPRRVPGDLHIGGMWRLIAAEQHGYEARRPPRALKNAEVWSGSVQADWLNALVTPVLSGSGSRA